MPPKHFEPVRLAENISEFVYLMEIGQPMSLRSYVRRQLPQAQPLNHRLQGATTA